MLVWDGLLIMIKARWVILVSLFSIAALALFTYFLPAHRFHSEKALIGEDSPPLKNPEELIHEAQARSSLIHGLYMTAEVANDQGAAATRLREHILNLADTTEINGVIIDVKEVCGPDYGETAVKNLLANLHQKNIWAIARIVVFKDAAQFQAHPDWYLGRHGYKPVQDQCARKKYLRAKPAAGAVLPIFWQDNKGGYWLDPASEDARNYILDFSKRIIDLGFDELQFDYIRFPSDGDVENAVYPSWDGKTPKYKILKNFFELLNKTLKAYKPSIILSADMFGYAAIRAGDVGIGQRLEDIGDNFDYISFMVYPSHYYSGLYLPADPWENLPAVQLSAQEARAHPDVVVHRSLLAAREFLDGKVASSTGSLTSASSTILTDNASSRSHVKLRPWLEDFFHEEDKAALRPWGVEKVKMQIEAAEKVENHGWMLWNAANVYSEAVLKKD